jgi:hypothetical protein
MQNDFGAQIDHRLHFDLRCGLGHDDDSRNSTAIRGERHALRMVSGGCADRSALGDGVRKMRDTVVRASQLE